MCLTALMLAPPPPPPPSCHRVCLVLLTPSCIFQCEIKNHPGSRSSGSCFTAGLRNGFGLLLDTFCVGFFFLSDLKQLLLHPF